jgi:hypothetical protein
MAKLDLRDISIAYAGATAASVSTAVAGSYVWSKFGYDVDYGLVISSAWLLTVGVPSCLVSMETLRRKLGEKQQTTVSAVAGSGRIGNRSIPVYSGIEKRAHMFMSSISLLRPQLDPQPYSQPIDLPDTFTVNIDDNSYSVTVGEIEAFLRGAWNRQRRGDPAFSRPYWTRQARPRLKPIEYYARLNVLMSVPDLILDRSKRRSGRLAVPPLTAVKALQGQFSL